MFKEGFFHRLRKSLDRVLFGYDLILSLVLTGAVFYVFGRSIMEYDLTPFVQGATSLSTSLVAIIIAGIAILVSLSNSEALKALKERRLYERFLFTFEFTAMLALLLTVIGIVIQTFSYGAAEFYVFLFFFVYMVFATATVISRLITYGDKMAQITVIESLPDDLGERLSEVREEDTGTSETSESEMASSDP